MVVFTYSDSKRAGDKFLYHREAEHVVGKAEISVVRTHHYDEMQALPSTNKLERYRTRRFRLPWFKITWFNNGNYRATCVRFAL